MFQLPYVLRYLMTNVNLSMECDTDTEPEWIMERHLLISSGFGVLIDEAGLLDIVQASSFWYRCTHTSLNLTVSVNFRYVKLMNLY